MEYSFGLKGLNLFELTSIIIAMAKDAVELLHTILIYN